MKQSARSKQTKLGAEPKRTIAVLNTLRKVIPEARTALAYQTPFELLVATILSAQCTDVRVNMVTPGLFKKYPSVAAFAGADQAELERDIHSTGFFRMKAKNIIACSRALVERFGGNVPTSMDELVTLPGVGRKTANVILSEAFGKNEGIVVDTHVQRLAQRLGFTDNEDPAKIEEDLMKLFPRERWGEVGLILILHGRQTCIARKPKCDVCEVSKLCPSAFGIESGKPTQSRTLTTKKKPSPSRRKT